MELKFGNSFSCQWQLLIIYAKQILIGPKWHHFTRIAALWLATDYVNAKFSLAIAPPHIEIVQHSLLISSYWQFFLAWYSGKSTRFWEVGCGWNRQRWRRLFRRRSKEYFPNSSRLNHTTADLTYDWSSLKNSKCKIAKPSSLSTSPLSRPTLANLCLEGFDRRVDPVEVKENIRYIGEVKYEKTMEIDCKETTAASTGSRHQTLNTCGLFDDLGKRQ